MNEQFRLQIGGKLENLSLLSSFTNNSMNKFGLGEYEVFQIQMALDKAVKNIIENVNGSRIQIKLERRDEEICIVIEYEGDQYNPAGLENSSLKMDSNQSDVYFIKKNMNLVEHEFIDGKNILTLIKRV